MKDLYVNNPKTWFGLNSPDAKAENVDAVIFGI